jgi:hypothetical protein
MTERPRFVPPPPTTIDDETPAPDSPRAQWSREDDELLLLDELEEIDEAPDDDRSDDVF